MTLGYCKTGRKNKGEEKKKGEREDRFDLGAGICSVALQMFVKQGCSVCCSSSARILNIISCNNYVW